MADAPAKLNYNQRKATLELMGLTFTQVGNGQNRIFRIQRHGAKPADRALENIRCGNKWVQSWVPGHGKDVPVLTGAAAVEALMELDMTQLQWLVSQ